MQLVYVLLFLYLVSNNNVRADRKNSALGPFDIILHHIERCQGHGNGNIDLAFKTKKFNRTTYTFDVGGTLKIPLDDSVTASVTAAVLTNGGYKNNYWSRDFAKACTTGRIFIPKILDGIAAAIGHPEWNCPFPKGNFTARDIVVSMDIQKEVPMFFYNKYRLDVGFTKHNTLQGCFSMFVDVIPRKTSKG